MLGKVCLCSHPLSPPLCCFFRYAEKTIISQEDASHYCCVYRYRLASFLYYLPLRPLSLLGCLHFFSQQNLLKVICKKKKEKKTVVKISFLQEIKSSRDIL